MSEGPSIYEQLAREKKLGRARRAAHGADTSLDEAEQRHEAIWDRVYAMRAGGPLIMAALFSWIAANPFVGLLAGFIGVAATLGVGAILGSILEFLMQPFVKFIRIRTENAVTPIGGFILTLHGVSCALPGVALTGIGLAVWPLVWKRWARGRMDRTDYSRLKNQSRKPQEPDFIIE